ncbi:MAG TPA: CDP-alcohol phosphatidyltransferase family protein [Candidatus Methylacidiphilales bacterium]|nr:CDP-alcohol phosphatidyltransferase family protein [Candidatus Methylacidiphilales bacterium]
MSETGSSSAPDRRPIKTRSAWWAQSITRSLVRLGVSPNQVSVSSVVFALIGAAFLCLEAKGRGGAWLYLGVAACIQLRLMANMFDGLIAVEGGRMTKSGELYNEIPDRIADTAFLAAAGYASHHGGLGAALGWSASVLAVATAYIRAIGARRGQPQDFCGPQAKPHRMFLLTVACVLACAEKLAGLPPRILFLFLIIINLGTLLTCIRRTARLARQLEAA